MQNTHKGTHTNPSLIDDSSLNGSGETLRDRIQRRAYELYVERGSEDGHAEQDWVRAESEIMSKPAWQTAQWSS